jgi:hypothetical protein
MPFVIESNYHITQREYESRKASAWPKGVPGSFIPGTMQASQPQPTSPSPGPVVTTQVVGGSAPVSGTAGDPFASFLQQQTPSKPRRKSRRNKS